MTGPTIAIVNLIVSSERNSSRAVKVLPELAIKAIFGQKVSKWGEQLKWINRLFKMILETVPCSVDCMYLKSVIASIGDKDLILGVASDIPGVEKLPIPASFLPKLEDEVSVQGEHLYKMLTENALLRS